MIDYPKIESKWDDEKCILTVGYRESPTLKVYEQVAAHLRADMEGKIRQSLIDLGWTPPKEESK